MGQPNFSVSVFEKTRSAALGFGCWLQAHYSAIFVAVFIGLLILPLRGFPGSFTDFPKKFWGYDELVRAYTATRFYTLGDTIFGDVFVRPPNWLVYTGEVSLDDYQNTIPFTEAELARIQQNLDGLDERLRAKGISFLVVIVPGKNTIYPEYMPPQVPRLGEQSRTDQLLAYQKQHGKAAILDLGPALREARKDQQVYAATDTHWNAYGVLSGYHAIITALQKDFQDLQPHDLEDFRVAPKGSAAGDISQEWVQGFAREQMVRLDPRFDRQVTQFALSMGNAQVPGRMVAVHNDADASLPRAVIYHDSFFVEMIPFLSDHLSWSVYHWAFKVDETFVDGEKPDLVIFEVTDRYLQRLLDVVK